MWGSQSQPSSEAQAPPVLSGPSAAPHGPHQGALQLPGRGGARHGRHSAPLLPV